MKCFTEHRITKYIDAVRRTGALIDNVGGFIEGTFIPLARPIKNQESAYNGWKRCHGIKFQAISFPDGMIGSFYGPVVGRRHDCYLLDNSKLEEKTVAIKTQYYIDFKIYGDPAYRRSSAFLTPFLSSSTNAQALAMNKSMSRCRIGVEWGFRDIKCHWKMLK